jgi:DNA-binding response OmpR family regulator
MTPQLLMIEDDERLAMMVGDYLRQSGFGFSHAADGAQGLSSVQHTSPDLVILDLMLPDMDGLQVRTAARKPKRPCSCSRPKAIRWIASLAWS